MSDLIETHFIIIPAIGKPERGPTLLPEKPSFRQIEGLVSPLLDGAEIEHVMVFLTPDISTGVGFYTDMFVDGVGAVKGLPVNPIATQIYHANVLTHEPDKITDWPSIHGTAVLFQRRIWF